jgi:hypothetical protein
MGLPYSVDGVNFGQTSTRMWVSHSATQLQASRWLSEQNSKEVLRGQVCQLICLQLGQAGSFGANLITK